MSLASSSAVLVLSRQEKGEGEVDFVAHTLHKFAAALKLRGGNKQGCLSLEPKRSMHCITFCYSDFLDMF